MKLSAAEKRVINALKYNYGSYIFIGFGLHTVEKDSKRLVKFTRKTLWSLKEKGLVEGEFPKLYLKDQTV